MREPETLDDYAHHDMARKDRRRLAYLCHVVDEIAGVDLHDRASVYASALGREEPNEDDYCAASRDALDELIRRDTTAGSSHA